MRPRRPRRSGVLVGIDTGGTFTDLFAWVGGRVLLHKVPSTPADPALAVERGLRELLGERRPDLLVYSSTVATNALLERRGARVALVTNAGFEDLIEIGRQNRLDLYALAPKRPEPLVPRELRFGVSERTLFDGRVLNRASPRELTALRRRLARARPEAIAVCLLHAYANPQPEERIAKALEPLGRPLSVSHRLAGEYREFERFSTAVVNAYVTPKMVRHVASLTSRTGAGRLRILQSSGTAISVGEVRRAPVRTILSGPAAGVVGAVRLARLLGIERFVTFDMGGTSTDVSLVEGAPSLRPATEPGGYPLRIPAVDIHTVGAGGGSIARVDAAGALRVGPQSAGADPGPACYGRGEAPTVTDADLVAGRLWPEAFLGGRMRLDPGRAWRALERLGAELGLGPREAALGAIRVVNANMERALRRITVERGVDPRDLALFAFGGAGPMHAAELARSLGIRTVVLPRQPGLVCALGALSAPVGREESATIRLVDPPYRRLLAEARPRIERARRALLREGVPERAIRVELWLEARFFGEAYEIEVPCRPSFRADFRSAHRRLFGHAAEGAPIEVVNLRVRASAEPAGVPLPEAPRAMRRPRPIGRSRVADGGGQRWAAVYAREDLGLGARLRGPALLVEMSATTWVPPDFELRVERHADLLCRRG